MSQLMRLWYLSHRRTAKAQARLRGSPEPLLFAHIKYGSRRRVWPKIRCVVPVDCCACVWRLSLRSAISAIISSRLKYLWLRPILMELVRWRVDRRLLNKDFCLAHVRMCTTEVTAMVEWKRPNLSLCHSPCRFLPIQVYILECHSFLAEGRCFPQQIFTFRPYLLYWLSSKSVK